MSSPRVSVFHESTLSLRVLKWVLLPFVIAHVVLATISGYRAIVQVYRVDVTPSSLTIAPSTTVDMAVTTSGRAPIDAELMLVQSTHAETLAVLRIKDHSNPSYDPRPIHGFTRVALTSGKLAHFEPGPALLRAVANGRSQWLRVPPPVITERSVSISPILARR